MKDQYRLPAMEHKFSIQIVGEESNLNWAGEFLYRRPTLRERTMIDVMEKRMNGDLLTIDPEVSGFNQAISHLRFTLKEVPDWFRDTDMGGNLYDGNVVLEIFNKCMEFEAAWRKKAFGGKPNDVSTQNKEPELSSQES